LSGVEVYARRVNPDTSSKKDVRKDVFF